MNSGIACPPPLARLLAGMVGLAFGGCATTYEVTVDALAKPEAEKAISYQIVSQNPVRPAESLRHLETEIYVRTALSGKGLYEAPEKVEPDVIIDLDYGISAPMLRRETMSKPVWVRRTIQSHTQSVLTGASPRGNSTRRHRTASRPKSLELGGYRNYRVTTVVYEKFLRMSARENSPVVEGQPPVELWSIDVTSEGKRRDLRRQMPVLVAATIEYIGTDTQGSRQIRLKDTDADLAFVRQGM